MSIKLKRQGKGVHRFMLNLDPTLYEWYRAQAFEERVSMSVTINRVLMAEMARSKKEKAAK